MTGVFRVENINQFEEKYRTKVRRTKSGGCMRAVYIGLEALYGDRYKFRGPFFKKFWRKSRKGEKKRNLPEGTLNTIDRVFKALRSEGITSKKETFTQLPANGWKNKGVNIPSLEGYLIEQVSELRNGSHIFGVAISGAIHSMLLCIDKFDGGENVFWMDQFSDGFSRVRAGAFVETPNITGQLDTKIRQFGRSSTKIWRLLPDKQVVN